MRNTEKVHRSTAPNLLVQFPLAELTLQLAVNPSKSRWLIPARADGKSRRLIPTEKPFWACLVRFHQLQCLIDEYGCRNVYCEIPLAEFVVLTRECILWGSLSWISRMEMVVIMHKWIYKRRLPDKWWHRNLLIPWKDNICKGVGKWSATKHKESQSHIRKRINSWLFHLWKAWLRTTIGGVTLHIWLRP
jgi:hypothetical protein